MSETLISWDVYEIKTESSPITKVMLRGRIRKFCLINQRNILVENAEDAENVVRFAVLSGEDILDIRNYLEKILPDTHIEKIKENVFNPVLSKMKVNLEERYTL